MLKSKLPSTSIVSYPLIMQRAYIGNQPLSLKLMINVRLLETYAGLPGARGLWQQLITQLVSLQYGDDARSIQPAPGDWGIDVIVGSLTSGPCTIWQAKYYPEVIGNTQRDDIIDSFDTLKEKSAQKGFNVCKWFLCSPTVFSGRMEQWWDKWRAEKWNLWLY